MIPERGPITGDVMGVKSGGGRGEFLSTRRMCVCMCVCVSVCECVC